MKEQLQQRLIPTYFNEFQCIGGACEDTCCAGWRIDIDQKTFKKYKKEKNPAIQKKLQENIKRNRSADVNEFNYGQFKMDSSDACTMLTEDGFCSIQNTLGEKALCHTCTIYPRKITTINNVFEKTLTLSCPEAARIILNRPEGLDFIEEEGTENIPSHKNLTQSIEENELFWKIRIFMIDTLQNRRHSIESRLLIITMFLENYAKIDLNDAESFDLLLQKYIACLELDSLDLLFQDIAVHHRQQLLFTMPILTNSFQGAFNDISNTTKETLKVQNNSISEDSIELFKLMLATNYTSFTTKYSFVLENYLVNAIFEKIKNPSLTHVLDGFTGICVDYIMLRLLISCCIKSEDSSPLDQAITIIQKYSKVLSHSFGYKNAISKILQKNHTSVLEQITLMLHI